MNSIAYNEVNSKDVSSWISRFFRRFKVGEILQQCNAYKERGVPALTVMLYLFQLVFRNRSMYVDMQTSGRTNFAQDTVYRFRNSMRIKGVSFIPVNSCLLSTENPKNRLVEAKEVRKQSYGAWIRKLAQTKGTDVVPELIAVAQRAGIRAKYVLFDSWFTSPKMIFAMKKLELDTVAMVKKTKKMIFRFNGEMLSDKEIYKRSVKRRGRSKYLLRACLRILS